MSHLRWIISGFVLGLFLALAPSCGQPTPRCNASNCSGCCTEDGECQSGQSANACGVFGGLCQTCGILENCQGGYCTPATGSTDGNDGGTDGGDNALCNPSNCAGCCAGNTCIAPGSISNLSCGKAGEACTTCTGTTTCDVNAGVCKDPTCNGCMQGTTCRPTSQQTTSACGNAGAVCKACGAGQSCVNGECQTSNPSCGPSNCNGCCTAAGSCLVGTSNSSCGKGGNACDTCVAGETCTSGVCQSTTPTSAVGSACSTNADCSALGAGATCRLATAGGNASYPSGYCTKECNAAGVCGTGAECFGLYEYGEDAICLDFCTPGGADCRAGYDCIAIGGGEGICWLAPLPTAPTPPTNIIGNPCAAHAECQGPSGTYRAGYCYPETSGFPGGNCVGTCGMTGVCASDALCVRFQSTSGDLFDMCVERCSNPGGGQSTCRADYTCEQDSASGNGFCFPGP